MLSYVMRAMGRWPGGQGAPCHQTGEGKVLDRIANCCRRDEKEKGNFLRSGVAVALAAIALATGIDRLMVKREVMSGDSSAGMLATLVCQEGGKVEALPDYAFLSMGHALTDRFVTLDNSVVMMGDSKQLGQDQQQRCRVSLLGVGRLLQVFHQQLQHGTDQGRQGEALLSPPVKSWLLKALALSRALDHYDQVSRQLTIKMEW